MASGGCGFLGVDRRRRGSRRSIPPDIGSLEGLFAVSGWSRRAVGAFRGCCKGGSFWGGCRWGKGRRGALLWREKGGFDVDFDLRLVMIFLIFFLTAFGVG